MIGSARPVSPGRQPDSSIAIVVSASRAQPAATAHAVRSRRELSVRSFGFGALDCSGFVVATVPSSAGSASMALANSSTRSSILPLKPSVQ